MNYLYVKVIGTLLLGCGATAIWMQHKIRKTPLIKKKPASEAEKSKRMGMEKKIDIACIIALAIGWIGVFLPCVLDLPYLFTNDLQNVSGLVTGGDMYEEQDISERRITIQDSTSGERISVRYNGQGIDKGVKASAKVLPHTSWGYIISVEDVR